MFTYAHVLNAFESAQKKVSAFRHTYKEHPAQTQFNIQLRTYLDTELRKYINGKIWSNREIWLFFLDFIVHSIVLTTFQDLYDPKDSSTAPLVPSVSVQGNLNQMSLELAIGLRELMTQRDCGPIELVRLLKNGQDIRQLLVLNRNVNGSSIQQPEGWSQDTLIYDVSANILMAVKDVSHISLLSFVLTAEKEDQYNSINVQNYQLKPRLTLPSGFTQNHAETTHEYLQFLKAHFNSQGDGSKFLHQLAENQPLIIAAVSKRLSTLDAVLHDEVQCHSPLSLPVVRTKNLDETKATPTTEPTLAFHRVQMGRYLGFGIYSHVYECSFNGRSYALKKFRYTDPESERPVRWSWVNEKNFMASFPTHPNLVGYFGSIKYPPCLLFELLPADSSLEKFIDQGRLDIATTIEITRNLCNIIDAIHKTKHVYLDIKGSNVLLEGRRVNNEYHYHPKLIDCGLVHKIGDFPNFSKIFGCSAPEITHKSVTEKSDVYGIGMLLFEMVLKDLRQYDSIVVQGAHSQADEEKVQDDKHNVFLQTIHQELKRLKEYHDCPSLITNLIESCVMLDPDQRPAMDFVMETLDFYFSSSVKKVAATHNPAATIETFQRLSTPTGSVSTANTQGLKRPLSPTPHRALSTFRLPPPKRKPPKPPTEVSANTMGLSRSQ